ncbi:glycosyltransferase family 4 protein [Massilia sp. DJPM01]|uniref:glycosyltransferase family 4 protein n=1 Tax=Massilia sp. DJPM01 TaxID=3024404 RepID=UPI00259EA91F|nr:glycosyltransferase family 4 protein [Massilia sp. DJPM01]MDM5177339.1 glycosyltransferase family 4 protein [Massilia sp. DJPM01]
MLSIAHLTSAHPRRDTRIFVKQCRTLARQGYRVTLVVADGLGDEHDSGVHISDVGHSPGRVGRMLASTRRVLRRARQIDADIYHLHDPELIPAGLRLKRLGKIVIFDAHEDLPLQLLGKPYLTPLLRRLLAAACAVAERHACRRFDAIVAATPFIRDKFLRINPNTVDVNNYPLPGEFDADAPWREKRQEVCYVGSLSALRGIGELVEAAHLLQSPARITLAGRFSEVALENALSALPGWQRLNRPGHLDREGVRAVMARALAGLVTLHPEPNYLDALPVKMFEYMAAGIPVIASDIPLWRAIIQNHQCGVCVDPLDPAAIAAAIDYFVRNPQIARRMGRNGRRAILEKYNWPAESEKLIQLYQDVQAAAGQRRLAGSHGI